VRAYVAKARARIGLEPTQVVMPQSHPLGAEAEVDFGRVIFRLRGVQTDAWLFVMRLSASGKAFRRAYWNQAQEVFLHAHVAAFGRFGGPAASDPL
jgi:transposase